MLIQKDTYHHLDDHSDCHPFNYEHLNFENECDLKRFQQCKKDSSFANQLTTKSTNSLEIYRSLFKNKNTVRKDQICNCTGCKKYLKKLKT